MIVESRTWFGSLVSLRGTSLQRTWMRLTLTVLVAIVVTVLHEQGFISTNISTLPFTLIGLALGIFLGFRNNTSYDRFWEGRKLWGRLVNTSRTVTRQVLTMVGPVPGGTESIAPAELREIHRELVHRVIAYVHVFRHHLRDEPELVDARGLLPDADLESLAGESNRPVAVLQGVADRMRALWERGLVDRYHFALIEESLRELTNIQGGCERIKSTPIPTSYTVLIHRIVATYAFALPFGIVDTVDLWTPVVVLLIGYAFFGLDAIGDEIEDPFGNDPNDLPLSTLSRMIEVNLRQRLGESELPPLLQPQDGLLS